MRQLALGDLVMIGQGREAEVFAVDDSRVLRLARTAQLAEAVDRERDALVAAADGGLAVPAVHERVEVGGRPGLVLDRCDTGNLLLDIARRPWRIASIARAVGRLHARMHDVRAPERLPATRELLRGLLGSALVPDEVRSRALAQLDALAEGDRLCHGDFHPGNVLLRGNEEVVIDWASASRGDPAADLARTRILVRHGAVGPDATRLLTLLARVGRGLLWRGYLRAYRRVRPYDDAAVARWLPVVAAARLAEDIEEERETLLALAGRAPESGR